MTEVLNPLRADMDALPTIIQTLKKVLGVRLAKTILGVDGPTLAKWIDGRSTPTEPQKRLIYAAGYVVDVLRAYLPPSEVKLWLVSQSEYLYGIPALELRSRPDDVEQAALNRISRGEYHELLHAQLQEI